MTEDDKVTLRVRALELALTAPISADKMVHTAKEYFNFITGLNYLDGKDVTILADGTTVPTEDKNGKSA